MAPTLLLLTFLSALITYIATPAVIKLAFKFGLVDNPKRRPHPAQTHTVTVPRAGGVSLFLGIFLPLFIFVPPVKSVLGILLGSVVLILVGLWDDRKSRSPYVRFITNCLAATLAIGLGVSIPFITNPYGGIIPFDTIRIIFTFFGVHSVVVLADIIALAWIVWTTNIVGWSGGVDGQLPGFVSISALVIGILSLRFTNQDPSQLHVTYLSFATAGAFMGFLPWNYYPQKIMPGYGGKTLAGFMLAVLSILSFSKLGTALLVLTVPMVDAGFILVKRVLSGKSPMWATSGHLHHHLLSLGWSRSKIAIFYWLISAVAGGMALLLNSRQKVFAIILFFVLIFGFIFWINQFRGISQKKE